MVTVKQEKSDIQSLDKHFYSKVLKNAFTFVNRKPAISDV